MSKSQCNLLVEELKFYEKNKEKFLHEHTNRYLLIKNDELIATFSEQNAAVDDGVRRFGTEPFLVRLSGAETPRFTVPVLALGLPCQS